jgi:hypothetical protein
MLARGHIRVVFIASEQRLKPNLGIAHYAMTKFANVSVARALAALTKETAVTVNSVLAAYGGCGHRCLASSSTAPRGSTTASVATRDRLAVAIVVVVLHPVHHVDVAARAQVLRRVIRLLAPLRPLSRGRAHGRGCGPRRRVVLIVLRQPVVDHVWCGSPPACPDQRSQLLTGASLLFDSPWARLAGIEHTPFVGRFTRPGRSNLRLDIFWWIEAKHGPHRPVFTALLAEWTNSTSYIVEVAAREARRFRRELAQRRRASRPRSTRPGSDQRIP